MNSDQQQQQRIMGYFIEEAREHLHTIEQGVLNLQDILGDAESINELFRAAHSIKGGAAMLGVSSIQHVAHRLEDFFKIIKESPNISVDERLKSLLLAGFDPLSELLDELQVAYRISDELTLETSTRVKPVFAELESYLNQLTDSDHSLTTLQVALPQKQIAPPEISKEMVFRKDVTTKMRDMLQLFRGEDNAETRAQLHEICNYFRDIGEKFDLRSWTNLATQSKNAIAQPSNSYRELAPILIRELKEAQDLVLANRDHEIQISLKLQDLLPYTSSSAEDDEVSTIFTTAPDYFDEQELTANTNVHSAQPSQIGALDQIDDQFDLSILSTNSTEEIDLFADPDDLTKPMSVDAQMGEESFDLSEITSDSIDQLDWIDGDFESTDHQNIDGPKVGASELKSLAVLFENDDIDFEAAWEDIESNETNMTNQGMDSQFPAQDEFADLLLGASEPEVEPRGDGNGGESEISQLFGGLEDEDYSLNVPTISNDRDGDDALFPDDIDYLEPSGASDLGAIAVQNPSDFSDIKPNEDLAFDGEMDQGWIESSDLEPNLDFWVSDTDANVSVPASLNDLFAEDTDNIAAHIEETSEPEETLHPLITEITDAIIEPRENDFLDNLNTSEIEVQFAETPIHDLSNAANEKDVMEDADEPLGMTDAGMDFLDDPFAIDGNLDQALMEPFADDALNDVNSLDSLNVESQQEMAIKTNIFDELGFDTDSAFDSLAGDDIEFYADNAEQGSRLIDDLSNDLSNDLSDNVVENNLEIFGDTADIDNDMNFDLDAAMQQDSATDAHDPQNILSSDDLGDFFAAEQESATIDDANISAAPVDSFGMAQIEESQFEESELEFINSSEAIATNELPEFALSDISANEFEFAADTPAALGDDIVEEMAIAPPPAQADDLEMQIDDLDNAEIHDIRDLADMFAGADENDSTDLEVVTINSFDPFGDSFDEFGAGEQNDLIMVDDRENNITVDTGITDIVDININDDNVDHPDDLFADNALGNSGGDSFDDFASNFDGDSSEMAAIASIADESNDEANDDSFLAEFGADGYDYDETGINEVEENLIDGLAIDELTMDDMDFTDASASSTIDSLVDFFQGDDDSEVSVVQDFDDADAGEITIDQDMAMDQGEAALSDYENMQNFIAELEGDYDNDVPDLNVSDRPSSTATVTDSEYVNDSQPNYGDLPSLNTPLELNGIDDGFDFDDLEAMIGHSVEIDHGVSDAEALLNQDDSSIGEMDFDDLEALLGDDSAVTEQLGSSKNLSLAQTSVNTAVNISPPKPADDFDDLESMLQSAFSKDVGPIKTKAPAKPMAMNRKQKLADSTMRVDVKYLDSLNNLVGELVVNRNLLEQEQERLQVFITNLLHQVQLLSDVSQRMRDQYDRSLLEASLSAGRGRSSYSLESSFSSDLGGNTSVSRDFEGIEFDRYNTFHVLSQEIIELIVRVRESASDIEFVVGGTDQVTRQLGTITTQVQDDLKQSRMVPFAQLADRLPRGVRDRSLKTGKQAELEVFGRETLIDKAILESLTDPLTHLVNNAIDHGLEDPTTRQRMGKSGTGRLTVRAYHQGNQTVISISDDGAGINPEKVKKSAVAKGVRTQSEVNQLNETEVYGLLFEAGFSTAAQADEFKGRGVGLDVVKTCLDEIRGVIIVESAIGKGTTFTIRLPLTLSISKAMFCISDRARIAFPVDGFEDMVEVPQSQIVLNPKGQPCLPWRDTLLPFQHLSNLLSYSRHLSRSNIYGKQDNDELCIIILRNDTNYLALQVDQFLGEYEIVIKQLEGPIPQPAGIAGATVLGDGRVMAIANVLELFDIASGRLRPSTSSAPIQPVVEEEVAADPTVLIVDDSITVRELLSLTFAKVGYRVEQAKDGQDAWEKLRAGLPCDMIFCDIEMPRMDGLDLLSRLQKDERLKQIPVAMLTSRGADRHRQSAIQHGAKGYFTKPYLEEELLSASKRLLNGETLPI